MTRPKTTLRDIQEMSRERDLRWERAKQIIREQVVIHGPYRRRLRRSAGLGVFKNDRIVVILPKEIFSLLFPVAGFLTRPGKFLQMLHETITSLVNCAESTSDPRGRTAALNLAVGLTVISNQMMLDFEEARKKYIIPWMAEKVGVVVIPDDCRPSTWLHENLHADVGIAVMQLMAQDGISYRKGYEITNQLFLDKLVDVERQSERPDLHRLYRSMIAPMYGTLASHGYEEIFARAEAAIGGHLDDVVNQDIGLLSQYIGEIPSNYEEIVRYCLPEIGIRLIRSHQTAQGFIQHCMVELGIQGIEKYYR